MRGPPPRRGVPGACAALVLLVLLALAAPSPLGAEASGLVAVLAEELAPASRPPRRLSPPPAPGRLPPLDLAFVLDATVSMEDAFPAYRRAVLALVDKLASLEPRPELRLGLLLFRDAGAGEAANLLPLDADRAAFEAALRGARAYGGGDLPEDIGAGLIVALEGLEWREDALRLLVIATDASPRAAPPGRETSEAMAARRAEELGVGLYAIGAAGIAPDGAAALRALARATGGAHLAVGARPGQGENLVRGPLEDLALALLEAELRAAGDQAEALRRAAPARLLEAALASLRARQSYPEAARRRGAQGLVRLSLRVGREGELLAAAVTASSGSTLLDRAALELARGAFPLPNPARLDLELELGVNYRLEPAP